MLVKLPPGFLALATIPSPTGSVTIAKTTGVVTPGLFQRKHSRRRQRDGHIRFAAGYPFDQRVQPFRVPLSAKHFNECRIAIFMTRRVQCVDQDVNGSAFRKAAVQNADTFSAAELCVASGARIKLPMNSRRLIRPVYRQARAVVTESSRRVSSPS